MIKLVIFDCDGTIVDSQHAIVAAASRAFEDVGLAAPSRADVISIIGLSLPIAIERLAPGANAQQRDQLVEGYKEAFNVARRARAFPDPLYPHAHEVLTALGERADLVLGVATGKSRRGVDILLEREGLGPYFKTIQTADTHPSKPHPSMILEAMAEAGVAPHETIMIGDTVFDIVMGVNAGVAAVGVDWGYHHVDLLSEAGANAIVSSWREIPDTIERLFRERAAA